MLRRLAPAVTALGLLAFALPAARAAEPTQDQERALVDASLKRLPFGKDIKAALRWVAWRMEHRAGVPASVARKRVAELSKSVVAFDGTTKTELTTSVVGEEFAQKNDESVLVVHERSATHYLFFFQGKLYKYVRPVDVADSTFVRRVEWLAQRFGEPTATFSREEDDALTGAAWMAGALQTRIVDKRAAFQQDLFVIEDLPQVERVRAGRLGAIRAAARRRIDPDLQQFLETSDDDE